MKSQRSVTILKTGLLVSERVMPVFVKEVRQAGS